MLFDDFRHVVFFCQCGREPEGRATLAFALLFLPLVATGSLIVGLIVFLLAVGLFLVG
jgi:hypothetical protein